MRSIVLQIALLLVILTGVASADVYRYTDNKGELHFVDDIAKVPKKYRKQLQSAGEEGNVNVTEAGPATPDPKLQAEEEAPPPRQAGAKVEVFMTSWCGYCKKMLRYLNEKGIPYTAYDIEKDSAAARIYREIGGRGVPVVRIGTHIVRGYNPEAVMSYYNGGK